MQGGIFCGFPWITFNVCCLIKVIDESQSNFLKCFFFEHSGIQPARAWFHVITVEGIWIFASFSKHLLAFGSFFFALCCKLELGNRKRVFHLVSGR